MTDEHRQELRAKVEDWMESKNVSKCPLCGGTAWAFDYMDVVFTPSISTADIVAGRGHSRTDTSEKMLLSRLREGRRILGNISGDPESHLIKLFCGNCAYVLLLDAFQVQAFEHERRY